MKNLVAFIIGAGIGAGVAYQYAKKQFNERIDKEIQSVKEVYQEKKNTGEPLGEGVGSRITVTAESITTEVRTMNPEQPNTSRTAYSKMFGANETEADGKEDPVKSNKPYIIPPEEFAMNDEYTTRTFTYFADGVLIDETDEPIDDVQEFHALHFENHFGENVGDEDSVYVRNDYLKCDYEILRDEREYKEVY